MGQHIQGKIPLNVFRIKWRNTTMIDVNVGVILSQEVEAQASELEPERNQKHAAKVIAIEKESEFDCEYSAKFCDLESNFSDDGIFESDYNGRYLEELFEIRCGCYNREREIKNDEIFKKRVKQKCIEIKEYSEMEVWNPNTEKPYVYDEDDFYDDYYDLLWNIDKGFKLFYQRYLQEQQ